MGEYCSVRVWQLKPGASAAELEELTSSGVLEMQRWIPGVKHLSLMRMGEGAEIRYVVTTTFTDYEAYRYWQQVEEEGQDYWERYASVLMHWEQLVQLVANYHGRVIVSTEVNPGSV